MKVFKHRNLMGLIYSVLLALPLCSILGRVLYVQWNKNAKDSYSGYEPNLIYDKENQTITLKQTQLETIYFSNLVQYMRTDNNYTYIDTIEYLNNTYNNLTVGSSSYYWNYDNYRINLFTFTSSTNQAYKFYSRQISTSTNLNWEGNITLHITANYEEIFNNLVYDVGYTTNGTLDNAFTYSVNELIKDNNFGEVNFVGLFDDLFLDSSNQVNALYLHFANWYMNYVLFISIVYILFLVLMWFINFIRKMLEQGMDFGSRGY